MSRTPRTDIPQRPKRVPVYENRNKLTVGNQDPNFIYRWVNKVDNRVQKFMDAGYEPVTHEVEVGDPNVDGTRQTTSTVVEKYVGGGKTAVLMRIRKDWYEADQAAKQAQVDAIEEGMRQIDPRERYGEVRITHNQLTEKF